MPCLLVAQLIEFDIFTSCTIILQFTGAFYCPSTAGKGIGKIKDNLIRVKSFLLEQDHVIKNIKGQTDSN